MSAQDIFGIVAILYSVANLESMGLVFSRNGGAMFVAFAAFPVQDPNVLVMILLAVPVPVIMWLIIARVFASRADKSVVNA